MTLKELEQYCGILAETEAIKAEIRQLYNPVKSPNGRTLAGSSTPSSPTETNAMHIISLKDQLAIRMALLEKKRQDIEEWVSTIEDAEVAAIVRWRYIITPPRGYRYTWAQVNLKVYGYKDYQYSMKKLKRYLDNCTKKTN